VALLISDLTEVLAVDPEFLPQLAYYTRQVLNLRSISNFLIAFAAIDERSRIHISKYFNESVRLPTDLQEILEFTQSLLAKGSSELGPVRIPHIL
jgi:telomerase protein component 1